MSSAEKFRAIKSSPYLEMAICKDSFSDTDDTLNNYPHMLVTSCYYYVVVLPIELPLFTL